ncbi:MAG TPA: hypothetical protein DEP35_12870 [Deltaproteobacteria bacterium]|jgi:hypothetical protein|nr:hypothetical protein [Deltaproteobacteria bacterium]
MSIVIHSTTETRLLSPIGYANESELQKLLELAPALLQADGDTRVAFVERQVDLPDAGTLDLLFVTAEGLPIAVKVKLARNTEARREVLAQAIDYLASLTELMVWELDEKVHGNLKAVLQTWSKPGSPDDFERRWRAVASNLRAGLARVVVVLDEAPPDLERRFRFLAMNSNLDAHLMTVERFSDDAIGEVLVPRFIVAPTEVHPRRSTEIRTSPELLALVTAYNAHPSLDLLAAGKAQGYRQIRPSQWRNRGVHYEFQDANGQIGAELHLESDAARPLADLLCSFAGRPVAGGASKLVWDPTWSSGRGRLAAFFPIETDPETVAEAMRDLIRLTYEEVSKRA